MTSPEYLDENYCAIMKIAAWDKDRCLLEFSSTEIVHYLNLVPLYFSWHARLIPLLYSKAHELDAINFINSTTHALLKQITRDGVIDEMAKKSQLKVIIDLLSSNNIPVILLKGTAFNNYLYKFDYPRLTNDVDILVQERHWEQSRELISKVMCVQEKEKKRVFDFVNEISYLPKTKVGANLDLHRYLVHPALFTLNEDNFWDSSIMHPMIKNENVRILDSEHALIHQALHAFKDMNFCKYNLVDTYKIFINLKPNINRLEELAIDYGASIPIYFLLVKCHQVIGLNIDKKHLSKLEPTSIKKKLGEHLISNTWNVLNADSFLIHKFRQATFQYVFTNNLSRPLRLQWQYLMTYMKKFFS